MTVPYNIARWFAFSVTIEPMSSYGVRGSPVYGAGAAVSCHIEHKASNVLGADGNEITSDVSLTVNGDVTVNPYDRVTLPDGSKRPVKAVQTINTPTGVAAMKVVFL